MGKATCSAKCPTCKPTQDGFEIFGPIERKGLEYRRSDKGHEHKNRHKDDDSSKSGPIANLAGVASPKIRREHGDERSEKKDQFRSSHSPLFFLRQPLDCFECEDVIHEFPQEKGQTSREAA